MKWDIKSVNAQGAFYVFPKIENPEEFVKKKIR